MSVNELCQVLFVDDFFAQIGNDFFVFPLSVLQKAVLSFDCVHLNLHLNHLHKTRDVSRKQVKPDFTNYQSRGLA